MTPREREDELADLLADKTVEAQRWRDLAKRRELVGFVLGGLSVLLALVLVVVTR